MTLLQFKNICYDITDICDMLLEAGKISVLCISRNEEYDSLGGNISIEDKFNKDKVILKHNEYLKRQEFKSITFEYINSIGIISFSKKIHNSEEVWKFYGFDEQDFTPWIENFGFEKFA